MPATSTPAPSTPPICPANSSTTSRSPVRPRGIEKLRLLADLGVDEVSVADLNGEFEQMERVGREIVPALAEIRTS
jgi:hypothetical protein